MSRGFDDGDFGVFLAQRRAAITRMEGKDGFHRQEKYLGRYFGERITAGLAAVAIGAFLVLIIVGRPIAATVVLVAPMIAFLLLQISKHHRLDAERKRQFRNFVNERKSMPNSNGSVG